MSPALHTAALACLLAATTAAASAPAPRGGPGDSAGEATTEGAAPEPGAAPRPSESDLFGAPADAAPRAGAAAGAERAGTPRADAQPGAGQRSETEDRLLGRLASTDNPLQIGGLLYLRSIASARQGDPPSSWVLTAPALVDVYLDARPSDRVRGFLLGRMQYDPTLTSASASAASATSLAQGAPPSSPSIPTPASSSASNPSVVLDQLWLRFDVSRVAFVTAGKQHVKWGAGRFWNPTDYLHTVRRDPLAPFDPRTGTSMVRLHFPVERLGWNFYAIAILEPLTASPETGAATSAIPAGSGVATPAGTVGGVGGAVRGEIVLGPCEIAAGAVLQRGHEPRFALDASAGLWEIDFYGEAAIKTGSEIPLWRERADATSATPLTARFETYEPSSTPQVTAGLRWAHKYSDEDRFELGVEYFYNRAGYTDRRIYPWLLLNGAFTPFYLGQQYAAAYLSLPSPGSWNRTAFLLSTVGNLSDVSFVTRLDHSVAILTYLRLETFVQVHYGSSGGEFRLGISVPPIDLGGGRTTPAVSIGNPLVDAGVALRLSL